MSALVRRRAFVASAAALICAALAPAFRSDSPTEASNARVRAEPLVMGARGSGVVRQPRAVARSVSGVPDPLARARARAFARAFVRYQAGVTASRTGALFARSASHRVRRALAASPPRRAAKVERAELGAVHVYPARPAEAKGSAVLQYRTGQRLLEFRLALGRGGWRVTELYP